MTIADLITGARNGSQRAAGRLLSLVEGEQRGEVLASIGTVIRSHGSCRWDHRTAGRG